MAVPTSITQLSTTASSNSPSGTDSIGTTLDDYLRAIQGILKTTISQGSAITAASTITPGDGNYFEVTGNTGITTIASTNSWNGREIVLKFSGTPTLTHSASLILPGSVDITCAAGDVLKFVQESSGTWRCTGSLYQKTLDNPTITGGYTEETYSANASSYSTIDLTNGSVQTITLNQASTTLTFPANTAGKSFLLIVKQDATGSRTITWDTDVKWPYSTTPTITYTASKADVFSFVCDGTYWYGVVVGQNYL